MSRQPFRFVVDARVVRRGMTGVGHYVAGLLRGLSEELAMRPNAPAMNAMVLAEEKEFAAQALGNSVPLAVVDADYQRHPAAEWFLHAGINRWMREQQASVLVSPYFLAPSGPRPFARVVGVLDDLLWRTPENYPARYRWLVEAHLRLSLPYVERTFTLSGAMHRSLARRFPALEGRPPATVPGAVDHSMFRPARDAAERRAIRVANRISTDAKLLVYVASMEWRKNHRALLEELHALEEPAVLALFGNATAAQERTLRSLAPPWVALLFFRDAKLEVMAEVLRAADLMVFPSRAEGFGLPVLEAMASGTPAVCSPAPVLREIHRGLYLSAPVRDGQFGAAVVTALREPITDEARQALLRRAARYTWRASAARLLALVEEAAKARR